MKLSLRLEEGGESCYLSSVEQDFDLAKLGPSSTKFAALAIGSFSTKFAVLGAEEVSPKFAAGDHPHLSAIP